MKLNWFSPLPPSPTDIAHYTWRILPALQRVAEVVLWTDQSRVATEVERQCAVRRYGAEHTSWDELNRAELTFYNIGNNPQFHSSIWHVSRRHPGIVVLHDTHLHHLFESIFLAQRFDAEGYRRAMQALYKADGRRAADDYIAGGSHGVEYMAERYPLTELALEGALGALVHTPQAFDQLKRHKRWCIAYAPLPYPAASFEASGCELRDYTALPRRLVMFGYIGRNRRVEILLEALTAMPEREHFRLDIYGTLRDESEVRSLVRLLNLERHVTLHGFVPEEELNRALATSHLAINLRCPTMGEASGSQLRIWSHALTSMVTAVGWYAALPPGTVLHVRPEYEQADIQLHLRSLLNAPDAFHQIGVRGRQALEAEHTPELYADTIAALAQRAARYNRRAAAFATGERIAMQMQRWLPSTIADEVCVRVAEELYAFAADETRDCSN